MESCTHDILLKFGAYVTSFDKMSSQRQKSLNGVGDISKYEGLTFGVPVMTAPLVVTGYEANLCVCL